jgi:hypothetical protein
MFLRCPRHFGIYMTLSRAHAVASLRLDVPDGRFPRNCISKVMTKPGRLLYQLCLLCVASVSRTGCDQNPDPFYSSNQARVLLRRWVNREAGNAPRSRGNAPRSRGARFRKRRISPARRLECWPKLSRPKPRVIRGWRHNKQVALLQFSLTYNRRGRDCPAPSLRIPFAN